jgi:hypothetical protein
LGNGPGVAGCSRFGCWFGRVVVVLPPLEVELDVGASLVGET